MKNFIEEFKKFALKGNVVDMAVGVVIGTAFSNIVNSLVNDIFMPIIASLTGKVALEDLKVVVNGLDGNSVSINYGTFIQNVVNFVIIALCLFLVVKAMNKIHDAIDKPEEVVEEAPKQSDELVALNKIVSLLEDKRTKTTKKVTKK